MGCDIHAYSEKRDKYKYWDFHSKSEQWRDYWFFGLVAGVRNPENTIFKAKGFPENASSEVERLSESWDGDGHSHSFLTLEDLRSIDLDKKIKISGMMQKDQLVLCQKDFEDGNYNSEHLYPYCGWGNSPGLVNFELEIPIRIKCKQLQEWIDHLESIPGEPDSKRIVFWFDN